MVLCCGGRRKSSRLRKLRSLLRLLLMLGCLMGFMLQSRRIVTSYLEYPSAVVSTDVARQGIVFPSVTVCTDLWTNKTRLCEVRGKCTRPAMKIFGFGFIQMFDIELRDKTAFEAHELLSCRMTSTGGCESFDCSHVMKRTVFRKPLQMCYTLDLSWSNETRNYAAQCTEHWNWEIRLESKISSKNSLMLMRTDLVPLVVKAPSTAPLSTLTQIDAVPGRDITVSMKQQIVRRLPAPYRSRCLDYTSRGIQEKFLGYHTLEECQMKLEMDLCGCITFTHDFVAYSGLPICVDFTKGLEYCQDLVIHSREFRGCLETCGPPCEEITYDLKLLNDAEYKTGSPDDKIRFGLTLKFSSDFVKVMEHYPMITVIEVLAYLGGTLGTWLGFNLLSLLCDFSNWVATSIARVSPVNKRPLGC